MTVVANKCAEKSVMKFVGVTRREQLSVERRKISGESKMEGTKSASRSIWKVSKGSWPLPVIARILSGMYIYADVI